MLQQPNALNITFLCQVKALVLAEVKALELNEVKTKF